MSPEPHSEPCSWCGNDACAAAGEPLGDVHLMLVRHRGEQRVPEGFCSVDHLREWAQAGGRYG